MEWGLGWKIWKLWGLTENPIFRGEFTQKQYIGGNCLKRDAWAVFRFKRVGGGAGGLDKKKEVVIFWRWGLGIDTPIHKFSTLGN